jgi:DNA-nicking Smr family endonuclease
MSAEGRRGKRGLRKDEDALWKEVTKRIAPLRRLPADAEVADASPEPDVVVSAPVVIAPKLSKPPKPKAPPALAPLGRRLKQRVARGHEAIDGRLDLHGLTQAEAHGELLHFLHRSQAKGAKTVIVITGKGGRDGGEGVLKRQVPLWLSLPEFRTLVIGFEDAHRVHGGEGALYVRLRKRG